MVGVGAQRVRIVLDVELIDESPVGNASTGDGRSRRFEGWLGLVAALEAALTAGGDADKGADE